MVDPGLGRLQPFKITDEVAIYFYLTDFMPRKFMVLGGKYRHACPAANNSLFAGNLQKVLSRFLKL